MAGIEKLGYGIWVSDEVELAKENSLEPARVIAVHKDSYMLTNGEWTGLGEVTGKLMFSADSPLDFPVVGDWCQVQYFDSHSPVIIHKILKRKSLLKRKTPGKKIEYQPIAANIDTAFIVQSLDEDFSVNRLERYLVITRDEGIEAVILLSKSDLLREPELAEKMNEVRKQIRDVEVVAFSNNAENGTAKIQRLMICGKTYCLLGSSGVGKTTLLNNLLGEERFETQAVRASDSKGRHTTTERQLIALTSGAMIVDTPGMRELGILGTEMGIEDVFEEIYALERLCRFNDCSHTRETGCAVLQSVSSGELSEERFASFRKLRSESEYYERSYKEKRDRDKKFGKLYKSVQKHNIKNNPHD